MKGTIIKGNILRKADELTGVKVTRLTDDDGDTFHPYFTQQLIDKENKNMIVKSTRTGTTQLYILDMKIGGMIQLTDVKEGQGLHQPVLDITNDLVYYFQDDVLKRLRLDNHHEEELLRLPAGYVPGDLSITNKGDYLAFSYTEKMEYMTTAGVIYSDLVESLYRRPRSVVNRYDVSENKVSAVWGENERISHTLISPVNPNYIIFCHEGGWLARQRLWGVKVDTYEVYPLIPQQDSKDRTVHEFYTAGGRVGTQYEYRHKPDIAFYLQAEIYLDVDGSNEERYYYPYNSRPGTIQMNYAQDLTVGDSAQIRKNMTDYDDYMGLMKHENHRITVGLLCRHGTSRKSVNSYPLPIFSRDDRHVIYTSDAGGRLNVYMAEANWEKCIKSE